MGACELAVITFADKLSEFLTNFDEEYDVVFSVGPNAEKIKALRLVLVVSSPVFRKLFKESRDQGLTNQENGHEIPLPNCEPSAFRIFLKLLLVNDVSTAALKSMKLSADNLFHLIELCEQYEMIQLRTNLAEIGTQFYRELSTFVQTQEFLNFPKRFLEKILRRNSLLVDEITLFKQVCKWAKFQLKKQSMKVKRPTLRETIGDLLFLIRFPTTSIEDFGNEVCPYRILTEKEELEIFRYLVLPSNQKAIFKEVMGGFSVMPRLSLACDVHSVYFGEAKNFTNNPPFLGNETNFQNVFIRIRNTIKVHGVGFLGPIDSDALYTVNLEIKPNPNPSSISLGKVKKELWATKQDVFQIYFDEPIILKDNSEVDESINWHQFQFSLKGPNTRSMNLDFSKNQHNKNCKRFVVNSEGVNFQCWWHTNQLVQLYFERM